MAKQRADEEGADGGMQVITRAAAILGALAEPEGGRSLAQLAAQTGLPKTDGAPHLHGARTGRLRAHRRRDRPPGARPQPAAPGGDRPARPAHHPRAARRAAVGGPQRDRRPRGARRRRASCSWRSTRRRSARSWPSRAWARSSPPTRWPAARSCWRSCRARTSCGGSRGGSSRRWAGAPRTREALLRELDEVRATGLGYEREEMRHGICAVAVAVTDVDGRSASIAVPMPTARFEESEERVAALLLELKQTTEARLGGA